MLSGLDEGMQNDRDALPSLWPTCIGFVLSQVALLVMMVGLSAAAPEPSSIGLRGAVQPEVSAPADELYPAYASPTLG
jgi:hypothetical protein